MANRESSHTLTPSRSGSRKVAVSLRRVCPMCGSLRVVRLGRGLSRRYECGECDSIFRGVRMLGMRVQW